MQDRHGGSGAASHGGVEKRLMGAAGDTAFLVAPGVQTDDVVDGLELDRKGGLECRDRLRAPDPPASTAP